MENIDPMVAVLLCAVLTVCNLVVVWYMRSLVREIASLNEDVTIFMNEKLSEMQDCINHKSGE